MNPPTKPTDNRVLRVFRGGSWANVAASLRAASRSNYTPANRSNRLGFRCVLRGREPRV